MNSKNGSTRRGKFSRGPYLGPLTAAQAAQMRGALGVGQQLGLRSLKSRLGAGNGSVDVLLVSDSTGAGAGDSGHAMLGWFGRFAEGIAARYTNFNAEGLLWNSTNNSFQHFPSANPPITLRNLSSRIGIDFVAGITTGPNADSVAVHEGKSTGDIRVVLDFTCLDSSQFGAATKRLMGVLQSAAPNDAVCWVDITSAGTAQFWWYESGGTQRARSATTAITWTTGQRYLLDVLCDVDNGASGHTVSFRLSTDGGATWSNIGDVVTAGVSSTRAFAAGAMLARYGSFNGSNNPAGVRMHRMEIYNDGGVFPMVNCAADMSITANTGVPARGGAPLVRFRNASVGGYAISDWASKSAKAIAGREPTACVFVALQYNQPQASRGHWTDRAALISALRAELPGAAIILTEQAPQTLTNNQSVMYRQTNGQIASFAAANGCEFLPVYDRFLAELSARGLALGSVLTDGLHLNSTGYDIWGEIVLMDFDAA